ncbi:MAG: hypothetical protein V4489_07380 [Chlamydiota bacterium]
MIPFKILENTNSAMKATSDAIQKQYEKNPTATVITGLALGALSIVAVARQINCPPKIRQDICQDFGLPPSTRGRYCYVKGTSTMTVRISKFNFSTLRWTENKDTFYIENFN